MLMYNEVAEMHTSLPIIPQCFVLVKNENLKILF